MSSLESTAGSVKSFLIEKLNETVTISRDAIVSRGWSYPILGIWYFVGHPSLYRSVAPVIFKALLTSIGITAVLFIFTYLPQVAFCALFSGPFAFFTAALMVLGESYAVITFVSKVFFFGRVQDKIFDAVLLQQGNETLVSRGREVKSRSGAKSLGKEITKPLNRFSKAGMLRYLISLPLNSLPVVGTAVFLLYNGVKSGPSFHARYFQMKGMDAKAREAFVAKRKGAYAAFGATALGLSLIPIAGLLFGITSTVGAALWASELEKKDGSDAGFQSESVPKPVELEKEIAVEL